ncbi:molybdopterin molybdotransferase MoeA [Geomonas sp. RF6]|uniref:molybdopterin molybdotransferase MoeA n=1 Tax=Geomonas sp. RF6 TaxID=2897342 RepID=UPI001E61ECDF|nr:gephyrin-like molybdotransferase Glp [Geomonas sp. RF6]UFS70379.1 molybdopterin molybdotransferase MoeA [Geomonas sp. RF6]
MISIEDAQRTVLERISTVEGEEVPLLQALNRVTTEDHISPWDIPPADNSAMDGYAFCRATTADRLQVTGFLSAGEVRLTPVPAGEAVKIMTGAPVPPGCDTVVPVEEVEVEGTSVRILSDIKEGRHLRRRGEDIAAGEVALAKGTVLRPQELSLLAAMGKTAVRVHRRARVAIISTGDELVEPGCVPTPGKIINSNSYALAAQVLEAGGEPILLGIAPDTLHDTAEKIRAGTSADFVVLNGGVSVGDKDYVKAAIEELGGSFAFWKVDMKPGKPLAFGEVMGKAVFALPGNPVAAAVSFELFVRPALLRCMGHRHIFRPTVKAFLQEVVHNSATRPHLMRSMVTREEDRYVVSTTGVQCSAKISSLTRGNALMTLPPECSLATGAEVEVMLLDSSFGKSLVEAGVA